MDNPATHLELTMIHEAMILEYAGPDLALVTVGEAMRLTLLLGVFVNLFVPWGIATTTDVAAVAVGLVVAGGQGGRGRSSRWPSSRSSRPSCGCSDSPSSSPARFVLALLGVVSGLVVK